MLVTARTEGRNQKRRGGVPGEYVVTGALRQEVAAAFGGKAESAEPIERIGPEHGVVVIRLKGFVWIRPRV